MFTLGTSFHLDDTVVDPDLGLLHLLLVDRETLTHLTYVMFSRVHRSLEFLPRLPQVHRLSRFPNRLITIFFNIPT